VLPTLVAGGAPASQLVHVLSGPSAPAMRTRRPLPRPLVLGRRHRSRIKIRFTLLMILSSLAETGAAAVAPLVTVPSRYTRRAIRKGHNVFRPAPRAASAVERGCAVSHVML
jgi:hypothetical protein